MYIITFYLSYKIYLSHYLFELRKGTILIRYIHNIIWRSHCQLFPQEARIKDVQLNFMIDAIFDVVWKDSVSDFNDCFELMLIPISLIIIIHYFDTFWIFKTNQYVL